MTAVTDIASHEPRADIPLTPVSATVHPEIALSDTALAACVGRYVATGEGMFEVAIVDHHLVLHFPGDWGLPPLQLRAESPTMFFAADVPVRVGVEFAAGGSASALVVHPLRGQKSVRSVRESAP